MSEVNCPMNLCKRLLYMILPYGSLVFIYALEYHNITLSGVYISPLQTLYVISLLYMGAMMFVVSHIDVEITWKLRVGVVHVIIYSILAYISYYGYVNLEDFFYLDQWKNRMFYVLGTQVHIILPIAMFMILHIVHTVYILKYPKKLQHHAQSASSIHADTWLGTDD